jgi:hypothetical protein
MNNMIYCNRCGRVSDIAGYEKDFILECGHTKQEAGKAVARRVRLLYCDICKKKVTVFVDEQGNKRCGGNLLNDPGCGRRLGKVQDFSNFLDFLARL